MEKIIEVDFLKDGDIVTIADENEKYTYYENDKCLKKYPNSIFCIEIECLKLNWIEKVERMTTVFSKGN